MNKLFILCLTLMAVPLLAQGGGDEYRRHDRGGESRQRPMGFVWLSDVNRDMEVTLEEWQAFVDGLEVDDAGLVDLRALRPGRESRSERPERPRREEQRQWSQDDLRAMFTQMDTNGDQRITTDEVPKRRGPKKHGKRKP